MIQARTAADESPAGYFANYSSLYQTQCDNDVSVHTYYPYGCAYICIYCIYMQAAATHTNNDLKQFLTVTWLAPPAGTGTVRFRCFYNFYATT